MTTAFITGIAGFVGSHLADLLIDKTDWEIVGMIRHRSPLDNIRHLLRHDGGRLRFVYADLRDTLSVQEAVADAQSDYVFHLAAQSFPQVSFTAPLDTIDTNTQGTIRLLDALRHYAPNSMIHVCSSSEVYGRTDVENVDEDQPFHPASPYAISKIGADCAGRFYAEAYDMHVQVTRMFTHTGPRRGDVFAESSFAKQIAMVECGLADRIRVGNLDSTRTVADVRDAVRAYLLLLTENPVAGAVYNIGGRHTCTVGDILKTLMEMAGTEAPVEQDPARLRPIDVDLQVPDCRRFRARTDWVPSIPFDKTMFDLLEYWRGKVSEGVLTR